MAGKSDIRVIVTPPPSFLTFVLDALRLRFHDTKLVLATKNDRRRLNWSKWLWPVETRAFGGRLCRGKSSYRRFPLHTTKFHIMVS